MYNRIYEILKKLAEFVQNDDIVWDHWKGHIKFLDNKDGVYKFSVDDGDIILELLEELGEYSVDSNLVRHYKDSTLCTWIEDKHYWKIQQFRRLLGEVHLEC